MFFNDFFFVYFIINNVICLSGELRIVFLYYYVLNGFGVMM